jgi:hypothetical protein
MRIGVIGLLTIPARMVNSFDDLTERVEVVQK